MRPRHKSASVGALRVLSAQYFLYFAVQGVFLPYFNLYCYHLGFSAFQIGLLSSARSITMTVMPIVWSLAADRFQARKPIYIFCNVMAALSWTLFLYTRSFGPMLLVTVIYGFFFSPIIAFLEAFSMDTLDGEKKRYGALRAWGSISFISVVSILGLFLDRMPISRIVPFILAGSALLTLASLAIARTPPRPYPAFFNNLRQMWHTRLVGFLVCAFLMLVSHGAYYGFFSIQLEALGVSKATIGLAWALASISEILVMLASARMFHRFSLESVLMFSFCAAALRWVLVGVITEPVLLLATQVLHAASYGAFHMSSILYMDRLTPEGSKTVGQSVNNAFTYGFGLMVGFFFSGWLYEAVGPGMTFFLSAGVAFTGGVLFWLLVRFQVAEKRP